MGARATAQIDLKLNDGKVRPALNNAEKSINSFAKKAKIALIAVGAGLAVKKLASWGRELLEIAGKQEKAEKKLQDVLKATNNAAGFTRQDDTLPQRVMTEPAKGGAGDGQVIELEAMLDEYYELRGWDSQGQPSAATLERLAL